MRHRFEWILLGTLLLTGCGQQSLYTGLPEKEVNEMLAILLSNDISCDKVAGADDLWNMIVDKSQFSQAVQLLNEGGYPKDSFSSLGETFKKSGLVSSPTEERIRFMYALSDELSETLTHIHGVVTARVHIVLPDNDPYTDKVTPSSASVFISHLPQINLDDCSRDIRQLVTNSIEGLSYDNVNLSLFPASMPNERMPLSSSVKKPNYDNLLGVKVNTTSTGAFFALLTIFFILGLVLGGIAFNSMKKPKKGIADSEKDDHQ